VTRHWVVLLNVEQGVRKGAGGDAAGRMRGAECQAGPGCGRAEGGAGLGGRSPRRETHGLSGSKTTQSSCTRHRPRLSSIHSHRGPIAALPSSPASTAPEIRPPLHCPAPARDSSPSNCCPRADRRAALNSWMQISPRGDLHPKLTHSLGRSRCSWFFPAGQSLYVSLLLDPAGAQRELRESYLSAGYRERRTCVKK
jgi:hypothetical protein